MAVQILEVKTDDIDGTTSHRPTSATIETVEFALDHQPYVIDLKARHAADLRSTLAPFVAAARRTGASRPAAPGRRRQRAPQAPSNSEIRDWARSNGHPDIPSMGRIAAAIVAEYHTAHGSQNPQG